MVGAQRVWSEDQDVARRDLWQIAERRDQGIAAIGRTGDIDIHFGQRCSAIQMDDKLRVVPNGDIL